MRKISIFLFSLLLSVRAASGQDVTTSASIAAAQQVLVTLAGQGTATITLGPTLWTGSVTFEVSNGGTFIALPCVQLAGGSVVPGSNITSSTTIDGTFSCSVGAFRFLRVTKVGGTGTVAATIRASMASTTVNTIAQGATYVVNDGSSPLSIALPPDAATETTVSSIDTKTPALVSGRVPVDGSGVTQPVSAAALPLPSGASTSANQTTANASLSSIDTKTPALVSGRQPVDGSGVTQPVSAVALPLPSGASTSANQTTANASLSSIDTKTPALVSGRQPVDGSGVTQPVSASSLPLPTGAATEATLSSIDTKTPTLVSGRQPVDGSGVTQPVSAVALPLPSGASTSANQTTANASLSSIDTKTPALVSGRQPVDGSGVTQPVSAAALPLPSGASTSANQTTANASLSSIDTKTPALVSGRQPVDGSGVTQPVSAASLPLPSGAATSANQTNGSQLSRVTDGTDEAQVNTTQVTSSAATGGVVTREAGQSYLATSAALTTNGQRFTVSTRHFNWANSAFTVVGAGGWDGNLVAVVSTDNGSTWMTLASGSPIYSAGNDNTVSVIFNDEVNNPYVIAVPGGVTDYGLEVSGTTTGSVTITAAANTLTNVVLAKIPWGVNITSSVNVVGSVTATIRDSSGNNLAGSTSAPVGTENALITRNIPSGTQPVSGTVAATQSGNWNSRTQDGSGNAIASSTSAPSGVERGLIVRVAGDVNVNGEVDIAAEGNPLKSTTSTPANTTAGLVTRPLARSVGPTSDTRSSVGDFGTSLFPAADGLASLVVQYRGTLCTDCELNVQAVNADASRTVLYGVNVESLNILDLGATSTGTYVFDIAGYNEVKVVLEEFTAGQASVTYTASSQSTALTPLLTLLQEAVKTPGSSALGKHLAIGGTDGTTARTIKTNSSGEIVIAGGTKVEGQAFASGDGGTTMLAVNSTTPKSTTRTQGDYEPLQVKDGAVWVRQSTPAQVITMGYNPLLPVCNKVRLNNCRPQ